MYSFYKQPLTNILFFLFIFHIVASRVTDLHIQQITTQIITIRSTYTTDHHTNNYHQIYIYRSEERRVGTECIR
jgi:hypothetical protein